MKKQPLSAEFLKYPQREEIPVDTWVLRETLKSYRIKQVVTLLFDKVSLKIGRVEDLPTREDGMTIYQQPRSKFYFLNITYQGKRLRFSSRCTTKAEARQVGVLLLSKLMEKSVIQLPASRTGERVSAVYIPTFKESSLQYIDEECRGKKTAWKREELCHRDIVPFFGKYRLDEITPQVISRWMNQERARTVRGGKKISSRSVNYNLGYLKRFFTYTINIHSWVKENPAQHIKQLPVDRTPVRAITEDEEKALLGACQHEWFKRVIIFALETGLRNGEIAGIKSADFHLDYGIPHFRIKREKNRVITEFPIVEEGRLASIIKEQMAVTGGNEYFFTDGEGKPLNISIISGYLKRAVKRAGLRDITMNNLRKTFCSRLNWLGCNKMFTEYLMGHTVQGIEQHYVANSLQHVYRELVRMEEKKKNVIPLSYLEARKEDNGKQERAETVGAVG